MDIIFSHTFRRKTNKLERVFMYCRLKLCSLQLFVVITCKNEEKVYFLMLVVLLGAQRLQSANGVTFS